MRKIKKKKQHFSFGKFFKKLALIAIALVLSCAVGLAVYAFHTHQLQDKVKDMENSWNNFMGDLGFKISDNTIMIKGREKTSAESIYKALAVPDDKVIMHLDLEKSQANLKALPWVKDASVIRQLPNNVKIIITERKAIALYQSGSNYYPIDEDGKLVHVDEGNVEELIIIVGKNAPQNTPALIKALNQHPVIRDRVMGATYIDSRRWRLYIDDLNHGIVVDLPEDTQLAKSLKRLEELNQKNKVLEKQIKRLDLRFEGKEYITPVSSDSILKPISGKGKKP